MTTKRILVVEDDVQMHANVLRIVRSVDRDISISWATNLEQAFRNLRDAIVGEQEPFDLLLVDIRLTAQQSGTTVWDFCHRFSPELPFAFMSGTPLSQYPALFDDVRLAPPYMEKPLRPHDCKKAIGSLLNVHEA
jgi:DNA-binding NtrC family response regulator